MAAYVRAVRDLVRLQQRYPSSARRRGIEGVVQLRVTLASDGAVEATEIVASDHVLLSRSAMAAVERAVPFPPPPVGDVVIELPIRWRLE